MRHELPAAEGRRAGREGEGEKRWPVGRTIFVIDRESNLSRGRRGKMILPARSLNGNPGAASLALRGRD